MPAVRPLELDDYGNLLDTVDSIDGQGARRLDDDEKGTHTVSTRGGRARGLHDPAATYFAMDVVAFNGSEWRAIRDDPGPLPGDGWMLSAKGARGKPGERGKDGVHVKAMDVVGYCLVLTLSNGQVLRANLLPALERFKKESGP